MLIRFFENLVGFQSTRTIRSATFRTRLESISHSRFQSTRPIRSATIPRTSTSDKYVISIHAPHTERDSKNA